MDVRLIDADDFIKNYCEGCTYECHPHYPKCNEIIHLENYAEENAKAARWIISSDGYYPYCSNCGARPQKMTKFCANCGAKMCGGDADETT